MSGGRATPAPGPAGTVTLPPEEGSWLPTPAHVIYIPAMLLLGLVVGYSLGARAVRAEHEQVRRKLRE